MARRLGPDKLGLLGAAAAIGFAMVMEFVGTGDARRETAVAPPAVTSPPVTLTPQRRPLPQPGASDPALIVETERRRTSGTGTAFAVSPGRWLTAQHVIAGCDRIGLFSGPRTVRRTTGEVIVHRAADLALISAAVESAPLPVSAALPEIGDTGYHYGYPGDQRGRVTSRLLGRATVQSRGVRNHDEPALVWAEIRRDGIGRGSLGGMSGGPTLNAAGELVGVTIAESRRRGRVVTAAPRTMRVMLDEAGAGAAVQPVAAQTPPTLSDLEKRGSVKRVLCRFG